MTTRKASFVERTPAQLEAYLRRKAKRKPMGDCIRTSPEEDLSRAIEEGIWLYENRFQNRGVAQEWLRVPHTEETLKTLQNALATDKPLNYSLAYPTTRLDVDY